MHGAIRLGMFLLITTVMCGCSHRVNHRGAGHCGQCQSQRGLLDIAGDRLRNYLEPAPGPCGCQSGYPPHAAPPVYHGDCCFNPGLSSHAGPCTGCGQLTQSYPRQTVMTRSHPGCTTCGSAPAMLGTPIEPTPSATPAPSAPAPAPAPPAEDSGTAPKASSASSIPPATFWKPSVGQPASHTLRDARRLAPSQPMRR